MTRQLNLMIVVLMLTGCASPAVIYPAPQQITITGDTLRYTGMITGEAVLEAVRKVRLSQQTITTLDINSPGGDMGVGIELGYFIKENNLNVIVSQLCYSACANYALPAAKHVLVRSGAMLGWHGGANQSDDLWRQSVPPEHENQFFAYLNRLRYKESELFKQVKVDQNISTYGQIKGNSCQKQQRTDGWHYHLVDLHHMGITNIEIEDESLPTVIEYNGNELTSCLMPALFD